MQNGIENGHMKNQNGYQKNSEFNIANYSDESGERETDPFAEHYGEITRQIQ